MGQLDQRAARLEHDAAHLDHAAGEAREVDPRELAASSGATRTVKSVRQSAPKFRYT